MLEKQTRSHRLLFLFAAVTILPAVSLAWLGWRMVEQDRIIEAKHIAETRDHTADLAAAALGRTLAVAEEMLTAFHASPAAPASLPADGATLIAFTRQGVLAHAGAAPLWYPAAPASPSVDSAVFAMADDMEYRRKNLTAAL